MRGVGQALKDKQILFGVRIWKGETGNYKQLILAKQEAGSKERQDMRLQGG